MTDQLTVSLDDLKRAIEAVPEHPGPCIPGQNADLWLALLHEHKNWALEAWRTAFEWRESLLDRALQGLESEPSLARWHNERDEGVRLIRERLR